MNKCSKELPILMITIADKIKKSFMIKNNQILLNCC